MSALKDLLISMLVIVAFGVVIGSALCYFADWTFEKGFWTGYAVGVFFDLLGLILGVFLRWRKRRRDRVYLTGKPRYGKH